MYCRKYTLKIALFLSCGLLCSHSVHAQEALEPQSVKWGAHVDIEGKIGSKRDLGELDFFLPLSQNDDTLIFGNIRGRFDNQNSEEGNIGIGIRHMHSSGWNFGSYAYFDRRSTSNNHRFNQITFGAEALSANWDVRANAYLPVGRKSHEMEGSGEATFSGSTITYSFGEEKAMKGFDAEIGGRIPLFDISMPQQLHVYGGGYHFTADGVKDIQGPRMRAEMVFDEVKPLWDGSRLSIGAEWQRDTPRGSQGFLSARLRIPLQIFGGTKTRKDLSYMERRMVDPIIRDVDIVSQAGMFGSSEVLTQTSDGKSVTLISADQVAGADLGASVTAAGANSTVIINGDIAGINAMVTMQEGQTIIGQGQVDFKTSSGRIVTLSTPGGSFTGAGGWTPSALKGIISMANNSTVSGMTITSVASTLGAATITVNGSTNAKIIGNIITSEAINNTSSPIEVYSSATGTIIRDNTLTGITTAAAPVFGTMLRTTTNTVFENNTVDVSGGTGTKALLYFSGVNNNISGSGNVGNVFVCTGAPTIGSVSFTNGTTCP